MNFNKPPPHPRLPPHPGLCQPPARAVRSRQVSCQHNPCVSVGTKQGPQPLSEKFERWRTQRARAPVTE